MKKLFLTLLLAAMAVLPSCRNLDDIYRRLDDYESRLTKVENLTEGANRDILALKALLEAQDKKLTIASWRPLDDNSGYLLTMSDGSTITLKNGKDGKSSAIDVRRGEDGVLYWTMNGQYMYDADGNKIKAQGTDGKSGVTPQLRVNRDGYWEYSLDGINWLQIKDENRNPVKATPDAESLDLDIVETNDGLIIITFKGKTFIISKSGAVTPEEQTATVSFTTNFLTATVGDKGTIEYKIEPADADATGLKWMSSREDIVKVNQDGSYEALAAGTADITITLGTSSATLTMAVTAPEAPQYQDVPFELSVVKNTAVDVTIGLKVPDQEMWYLLKCDDAETYDKFGPDRIHEDWVMKGWKDIAGDNWKAYIPIDRSKGNIEDPISNTGAYVVPGTEYVSYVYGIDEDGNRTTLVKEIRFTMENMKKVAGLTFDIKIEEYTADGPIVVITPSDPERNYVINIQPKNIVDQRKSQSELEFELLCREIALFPTTFHAKGTTTFAPGNPYEGLGSKLKWKDYMLLVYGFDEENGVNTVVETRIIPKGGVAPTE